MPKLGTKINEGQSESVAEREVLKRLTRELDVHPRDVVVLKYKKSARHKDHNPEDPDTWFFRRYLMRRNGAIYDLYLDTVREPGDEDPVGKWAEAVLVANPSQEMTIRFAAIAARRAAAGGQKRIIPVGHPDFDGTQESERPDDRGIKIDRVSIGTAGGVDLMEGSAVELNSGEQIDTGRESLGEVGPTN